MTGQQIKQNLAVTSIYIFLWIYLGNFQSAHCGDDEQNGSNNKLLTEQETGKELFELNRKT